MPKSITKPKTNTQDADYDIIEHVHRFASWAASNAASVAAHRFKVRDGKAIIEAAGLRVMLAKPHSLPKTAKGMDAMHKVWRASVITAARKLVREENGQRLPPLVLNHGGAAKLINVYLKAGLVTIANKDHAEIRALHPPIDRVLLQQLAMNDCERAIFWHGKWRRGWTNFNSKEYQEVIDKVREKLGARKPLWTIERCWPGFAP